MGKSRLDVTGFFQKVNPKISLKSFLNRNREFRYEVGLTLRTASFAYICANARTASENLPRKHKLFLVVCKVLSQSNNPNGEPLALFL